MSFRIEVYMSKKYSNNTDVVDDNICPYCRHGTGYDYTVSGIPDEEFYRCQNCDEVLIMGSDVTVDIYTSKPAKIRLLDDLCGHLKGSIFHTNDDKSGRPSYVIGSGFMNSKPQYRQVYTTEAGKVGIEHAEWLEYEEIEGDEE